MMDKKNVRCHICWSNRGAVLSHPACYFTPSFPLEDSRLSIVKLQIRKKKIVISAEMAEGRVYVFVFVYCQFLYFTIKGGDISPNNYRLGNICIFIMQ